MALSTSNDIERAYAKYLTGRGIPISRERFFRSAQRAINLLEQPAWQSETHLLFKQRIGDDVQRGPCLAVLGKLFEPSVFALVMSCVVLHNLAIFTLLDKRLLFDCRGGVVLIAIVLLAAAHELGRLAACAYFGAKIGNIGIGFVAPFLMPFCCTDGYWLLSDIVAVPNLRSRERYALNAVWERFKSRDWKCFWIECVRSKHFVMFALLEAIFSWLILASAAFGVVGLIREIATKTTMGLASGIWMPWRLDLYHWYLAYTADDSGRYD